MLVAIKDILPNPFRNIEHYPINREKVEALKASMDRTEFWDNILGRKRADGKIEQAYGHHRKIALLEHYGANHKVEITIRDLSDGDMIVIMAQENMEEWSTSAIVEIETVEAVVKAFAEGKITLSAVDRKSKKGIVRYAPSFIPDDPRAEKIMAYTAQSVADFLGWVQPKNKEAQTKVHTALTALQYIEEGIVKLSAFEGLGTKGIEVVIIEARRARMVKEGQAKIAARIAKQSREDAEKAKRAEEEARKEAERYRRKRKEALERKAHEEELRAAREREEAEQQAAQSEAHAAREHKAGKIAAARVTKAVAEHVKGGGGYRNARDVAFKAFKERTAPPNIGDFLEKALREVSGFLYDDALSKKLNTVLDYKTAIDEDALEKAHDTLCRVSKRVQTYADRFKPDGEPEKHAQRGSLALHNKNEQ
jgi:ParB-like chromosome segregation protein Spo0J